MVVRVGDDLKTEGTDFDRSCLEGFEGFVRIGDLGKPSACCELPAKPGVYLVIGESALAPVFVEREDGYPIEELRDRWVFGATIIYIGKAGDAEQKTTLRRRISAYMRQGNGHRSAGHRGGRSIWQLEDCDDLLVAWKVLDNEAPAIVESMLLDAFRACFGKLPFANRRR